MPIEIYPDNNDYIVSRTTEQVITGAKTFMAGSAGSVPLVARGTTGQTGNLQEWRNSVGTNLAKIDSAGTVYSGSNYLSGNPAASTLHATANGPARVPAIIQGAASQTANLLEIKNSAGTVLARSDNIGNLFAPGVVVGTVTGVNAALTSGTTAAGQIGQVVRGFSGQTANLVEWQNSAGGMIAAIGGDGQGYLTIKDASEATIGIRRVKAGPAGSGPGGVGRALWVD